MSLFRSFTAYRQLDAMDCGPTCLRMVAKHYGKHYSPQYLKERTYITREGVTLKGISEAAEHLGFRTMAARLTFEQLDTEAILPCILHWNQTHFIVLPPQDYDRTRKKSKILVADPMFGLIKVERKTFLQSWTTAEDGLGIALLLEPTNSFYREDEQHIAPRGFSFLLDYLKPYRRYIAQIFIGMLIASLLSLIAPFLTQSLVDYGINQQNLGFIYLVLTSQLLLFVGNTAIGMIRSWLLLHISVRINMSIISDFLIKLMALPIRFFDTKMVGDITQRINDHSRLEQFVSNTSLTTLFSFVNFFVFSAVMIIYSWTIFAVFLTGSALSVAWILFFMRRRKDLDYARFQTLSENQNNLFEIITGMQEIKINDGETAKRWNWERVQSKLFRINMRSLALEQYQSIGSGFFFQLKNILVSFLSAKEVLSGHISLGMMLSISYIVGQLNSPLDQLLTFIRLAQDARISLDRIGETYEHPDEEKEGDLRPFEELEMNADGQVAENRCIALSGVSFQYGSPDSPFALDDINLKIPFGKVTAIVGASGCGKTTLMKLLLNYYQPQKGRIFVGSTPLSKISPRWWRGYCGVVLTDGYIFSDTIARNISIQEEIDNKRLMYAARMANVESFIQDLPMGFSTKIGNIGLGISSGQRQRILIARAIYKDPQFLLLDEATSTLDANNERKIIENLESFFMNRTVVVIAHRLSTVKHAHQIIVMDEGRVVETGDHRSLTAQKGKYYELVKNQLELGAS
jgi:ATP-binding cassette subfamily B protein